MTTPLHDAITTGEVLTEARAALDYQAHGQSTKNWIVSHEVLRRKAISLFNQNKGLQKQVASLNQKLLELQEELATMRSGKLAAGRSLERTIEPQETT